MKNRQRTFKHVRSPIVDEPFHYTQCGLDDVYLMSGVEFSIRDGKKAFRIHDLEGLHKAIGLHLVRDRKALSPKEMRFLRKEMDLTQAELAARLEISSQQIARYEKGESEISGPTEMMLRIQYTLSLVPDEDRAEALRDLAERARDLRKKDEVGPSRQVFTETAAGWTQAAA